MITIENCGYSLEELLPIVSEAAAKYGDYEHSSITYEKAQMLMEAVLYCINEYYSDSSHSLLAASVSAKEAYQHGQDIVIHKF